MVQVLTSLLSRAFSKSRSCQAPAESDGEEGIIGEDDVVWDEVEVFLCGVRLETVC